MNLYIGLMSGTSMDGVDAALVSFDSENIVVVGSLTVPYSETVLTELMRAVEPDTRLSLHEFASLDIEVGRCFARAAMKLISETETSPKDVIAIGSHGQTLRHSPNTDPPYSVQIGDPATVAMRCSITTVADFRSLDLAAGGQGAPLVPAFHEAYLRHDEENTVVINVGGIANITVLPAKPSNTIEGFDTGPGNCLLDEWASQKIGEPYDEGGRWAASGQVSQILLKALMADDYIQRAPAKSTGREHFNLSFLTDVLAKLPLPQLAAEDIQATLTEYTAAAIAEGVEQTHVKPDRALVCGGGAKNETLMRRLRDVLPCSTVQSTDAVGMDADLIEAMAFAWLARQRLDMETVRLSTGSAGGSAILGAVYEPSVRTPP
ncbi:MAG: anhydro-N-acetylmuramic acid kinase [Gammaproteobacteria bacterium]|nr:anhydro-N-acetylmuramic acid kinase [Gammaproteobacteria bacterium]